LISENSINWAISYSDWYIVGIEITAIESEQQASYVMKYSALFSEKIPVSFISGVPFYWNLIFGHSFFLIIILDNDSTSSSTYCHVFHAYASSVDLFSLGITYSMFLFLDPKYLFSGCLQTDLLKLLHTVLHPLYTTVDNLLG
jgi:hypothetical protein